LESTNYASGQSGAFSFEGGCNVDVREE